MNLFDRVQTPRSQSEHQFALDIVHRLQQSHHIAYFAGGCVRDALMGNSPKDFDVATSATTEQVLALFGPRNTLPIGAAFGVACVHGRVHAERCQVEVATFRRDGEYSDGRHPDWVEYATPEWDAQRRDFTINGMFYDPIANQLIDYVGGALDIERRVVRAIGNPADRFREDKLRMMRAIRFAARFEFDIDLNTRNALQQSAPTIPSVSGERIAGELEKILAHPRRAWGMQQVYETGLMQALLPDIHRRWSDEFVRSKTLGLMDQITEDITPFETALAALYYPLSGDDEHALDTTLGKLKESLKLSNLVVDAVTFTLRHCETLLHADTFPWSVIQPLLVHRYSAHALRFAQAMAAIQSGPGLGLERCRQALALPREQLDPPPLLNGEDLMQLQIVPGPKYAAILKKIRTMQLDNHIATRDQAIRMALELNDRTY